MISIEPFLKDFSEPVSIVLLTHDEFFQLSHHPNLDFRILAAEQNHSYHSILAVLPDSVRDYLTKLRLRTFDQEQAVSRADSTDFDRGFTNHHHTFSVTPPQTPSPKSTT